MIAPPRPRFAARILPFALAGLVGLLCAAAGGSWLLTGQRWIFGDFPRSTAEAVAGTAGGIAVAAWALARLRRERHRPAAGEQPDSR